MRAAVLAGVAGTVVTGCAWFSGRLVRPLGGSRRGPLGVGHDPSGWRLHADRGGDTGGDHRARRLFRPARRVGPRERCHAVSRLWVPVLQVPTLAGARVTVSFAVTMPCRPCGRRRGCRRGTGRLGRSGCGATWWCPPKPLRAA